MSLPLQLKAAGRSTLPGQVVGLVARVSPRLQAPIILFQYYNPILRKGPDEYCRQAKEAGAAGVAPPTPERHYTFCMGDA